MIARLTQWRLSSISAFGLGIALTGGCMLSAIAIYFDPETADHETRSLATLAFAASQSGLAILAARQFVVIYRNASRIIARKENRYR